jgi:hypothetical protein
MAQVNRKPLTHNNKVIPLSPGAPWTFWDFCLSKESNPIESWYQSALSDDGKFLLDSLLKSNRKTALPNDWVGFRKFLKGKPNKYKIWELGFRADGRQYRVFGTFGTVRKQAILLLGCYHKGGVYTPPDSLEQAYKRARMLAENKAVIHARPINDDL